MIPDETTPQDVTQVKRPWHATLRTGFQFLVGLAVLTPAVLDAVANGDGSSLGGWAVVALGVSGAVTRVMALPGVEAFLANFLPFLAADPNSRVR